MTLTELCEELKTITYGESPDEPGELAPIVNMALSRIFSDKKIPSVYSFFKKEILPINKPLSFHKKGGESVTVALSGSAFGMYVSGKGSFTIVDETFPREVSFDTLGEFFSELIHGSGELRFDGKYSYDVYSLSFYDEISSDNLEDIPTGEPKRYSLYDMIPYLDAPRAMPKDEAGRYIDGAEYIGRELYLPADYTGRVFIEYYLLPKRVSPILPNEEISIEQRYLPHLLHLSAYYALLECDTELAEKHLESYIALEDGEIKSQSDGVTSFRGEYLIEDGWA
jgi:hypothetical protein